MPQWCSEYIFFGIMRLQHDLPKNSFSHNGYEQKAMYWDTHDVAPEVTFSCHSFGFEYGKQITLTNWYPGSKKCISTTRKSGTQIFPSHFEMP